MFVIKSPIPFYRHQMISFVLQELFELFPSGTIFEYLIQNDLADQERMHTADVHETI